jgi:hypothetical protein
MAPAADGRIHACAYCGAKIQVAIDADQLAAGLKLDAGNIDAFLVQLETVLAAALGHKLKVQRDGDTIVVLEINLDPELFVARRDAHGVVGQHKRLVRGVALKTATHPLDRWVVMLHRALAAHANENARLAQALTNLRM